MIFTYIQYIVYSVCGIAGGLGEHAKSIINSNLDLMRRRGPDSQGTVNFQDLTLSVNRLAMVDPHSRSDQPMLDNSTGNIIAFNGEIYNFRDLRLDLEKRGILFKTESDTEVLLKSLTIDGRDCLEKLEGMFAFAFFNKEKNSLLLARDYLGKKPLYYCLSNSKFFFASESRFVRKFQKSLSLNLSAIYEYLRYGYLFDPHTIHNEINSLRPGEFIVLDLNRIEIDEHGFIVPNSIKSPKYTSIKSSISHSLGDRVYGHENKFALSLSGGLDSTILALECSRLKLQASTYSLCFPDSDKHRYNFDADSAEKVANYLKLDYRKIQFPHSKEIPDLIKKYVLAMDEPNANPTGLSMMFLYSEIAKDGHKLIITGDGSDEVFGGYGRYNIAQRFRYVPNINLGSFMNQINQFNSPLLTKAVVFLDTWKSNSLWKYFQQSAQHQNIKNLIELDEPNDTEIFGYELHNYFNNSRNRTASIMFKDLRTWLPMESNRRLDRISMWYSIEARSPFQSEKVIGSGLEMMNQNLFKDLQKNILFEAYPELLTLPINKSKAGFISPVGHWLRNNQDLINNSLSTLLNSLPFNKKRLMDLKKAPFGTNFNEIKLLWSLLILDQYLINIDNEN